MKKVITEQSIINLLHGKRAGAPAMVLEHFDCYSTTEQQQINESYDAFYDLLMSEVIHEMSLGGMKAKLKGAGAAAKAAFNGEQGAADTGKQTELQSLFDSLKKNIGTIVAQHKGDVSKMGFSDQDAIVQQLNSLEQTIQSSPAKIDIKDTSLMGKAGEFAKDKVLPVVMKAVSPIVNKIDRMYQNSGPIKDFDNRYDKLIGDLTQKYPNMSETIGKFSEMAKQNKGKATFVIGALTAILTATGAFAAGGMAAFVVGVGLRGVYGMLAGEPPAKAFGKATITAAIGKLAGAGIKELFGDVSLSGGDETIAKSGVGELTSGGEVAGGGDEPLWKQHYTDPGLEPSERLAIRIAMDHPSGYSADYLHDVMMDKDLQPYFMDGQTINRNKLNGMLDLLKQHYRKTGYGMPGKEHFNTILQHHLNGGAPEDLDLKSSYPEPDSFDDEFATQGNQDINDMINNIETGTNGQQNADSITKWATENEKSASDLFTMQEQLKVQMIEAKKMLAADPENANIRQQFLELQAQRAEIGAAATRLDDWQGSSTLKNGAWSKAEFYRRAATATQ